jgi:hypothetical protein
MRLTALAYKTARGLAWANAIAKAAEGNPRPLARRLVFRPVYKAINRVERRTF